MLLENKIAILYGAAGHIGSLKTKFSLCENACVSPKNSQATIHQASACRGQHEFQPTGRKRQRPNPKPCRACEP